LGLPKKECVICDFAQVFVLDIEIVTNFMKQSPSCEASSREATQEILLRFMKSEV